MIDKNKYMWPREQQPSREIRQGKDTPEIHYVSLKDVKITREPVTIMGDEALTMEEHRRVLERIMRLPSHLVISQKGDIARAYRQSIDPDVHSWSFLFEEIHDELKAMPPMGRVERRREPIPYVPPVDETFLKEISKQVWASVLPKDKT